jgi:hypothetical protein
MVLHPWLTLVNGARIYRLTFADAAIAIFILAALAHHASALTPPLESDSDESKPKQHKRGRLGDCGSHLGNRDQGSRPPSSSAPSFAVAVAPV